VLNEPPPPVESVPTTNTVERKKIGVGGYKELCSSSARSMMKIETVEGTCNPGIKRSSRKVERYGKPDIANRRKWLGCGLSPEIRTDSMLPEIYKGPAQICALCQAIDPSCRIRGPVILLKGGDCCRKVWSNDRPLVYPTGFDRPQAKRRFHDSAS